MKRRSIPSSSNVSVLSFFSVRRERFQLRGKSLLHALQFFHESRAAISAFFADGGFDFVDLRRDEVSARVQATPEFSQSSNA